MGWWACLWAPLGAAVLARRARWSWAQVASSAAAAAIAAFALRWAVIATLSPAYPDLAPALAGPWTALAVTAVVIGWLVRDHWAR